jgi:hypothetical protein
MAGTRISPAVLTSCYGRIDPDVLRQVIYTASTIVDGVGDTT